MSERSSVVPATTLVDANVLIDVVMADRVWSSWSESALAQASDGGWLVINPVVFAEVSVTYATIDEIDAAVPPSLFHREPVPYEAAFVAGKAFDRYRCSGGNRRFPLPDFFIGAHAAVRGYRLLTRDPRRYRTYFPTVDLVAPT